MSLDQIKQEIRHLPAIQLDQLAALILQLRRSNDPERGDELSRLIEDEDLVAWKPAPAQ